MPQISVTRYAILSKDDSRSAAGQKLRSPALGYWALGLIFSVDKQG